jgi:ribosome recycling factor
MDIKELDIKLKNIVGNFKNELLAIRANRPSPKIVEDVAVEYLGTRMTVKQLGSISVIPPREIQISFWDHDSIAPTAKAIETANLGLSVAVNGNIVRVTLPALSDERRLELVKITKKISEEARIRVRSARDDENKKIDQAEKSKIITKDDQFKSKKKSQELVDKANQEIELNLNLKIKEISE